MGFEIFSIIGLLAVVFIVINILRLPNLQTADTRKSSVKYSGRSVKNANAELFHIEQ
ncbi:MAG TPA: hypothetical protein VHO28_09980 [Ignavibacteriales bacterium]|nr:hypothetical protein [Ignavibacteriales bacterium]